MEERTFLAEVKKIQLLKQNFELLDWDMQTGMPEKAIPARSELQSYISELAFEKEVGPVIQEAVTYFSSHEAELSEVGLATFKLVKEAFLRNQNVPPEKMAAYQEALGNAHGAWLAARKSKKFDDFLPALAKNITLTKELITYWQKEEATPYDVLLNQYEPGLSVAVLDQLFAQLKTGLIAIREKIANEGIAPNRDFISRTMTKAQQKRFAVKVIEELGFDFMRGRLDDTVHPFMTGINPYDARITTRWNEHDFTMAIFGILHEAGHGMYEQDIDLKFANTPAYAGTSMGIHESQSLFNEIMIGSNKAFWQKQYPWFQECAEGTFDDVEFETFYKGLKETKASLIRIEADSLTYPLHIIIRYELEKAIFNDDLPVADLARLWNQLYADYLGITPENDREGILQDVHWSAGLFGYFPSYAIGFMNAAQLFHAMQQSFEVDTVLASTDYTPIKAWLTEHIHQYGASKKPNELMKAATGETTNPRYLLDYLQTIYFAVYGL
jgi:carboxypeptidase Taq